MYIYWRRHLNLNDFQMKSMMGWTWNCTTSDDTQHINHPHHASGSSCHHYHLHPPSDSSCHHSGHFFQPQCHRSLPAVTMSSHSVIGHSQLWQCPATVVWFCVPFANIFIVMIILVDIAMAGGIVSQEMCAATCLLQSADTQTTGWTDERP